MADCHEGYEEEGVPALGAAAPPCRPPCRARQERVPALPRFEGRVSAETGAARFVRGQQDEEETTEDPMDVGLFASGLIAYR